MHKAWADVHSNKESYNLDQHNIRLAEANLQSWDDTIRGRITETYIWMLVPRQDVQGPVEIEALKVNGRGTLAERASRKAADNDLLVTRYAASNLRMELDRVPLWRDQPHVGVHQVWEDFTRYLYLPRLRSFDVLLQAIQDGPQQLNGEHDGFGYAEGYDKEASRYRGLVLHDAAPTASLSGLLVQYGAAQEQWQADQQAAKAAREASGDGAGTTGDVPLDEDGDQRALTAKKLTRFSAWKEIDAVRASRDAATIADEVLSHFTDRGKRVRVVLEIEAEDPEGFDDNLRRVVTENANTLGFGHHEFG
jgi:hypothetical protein